MLAKVNSKRLSFKFKKISAGKKKNRDTFQKTDLLKNWPTDFVEF